VSRFGARLRFVIDREARRRKLWVPILWLGLSAVWIAQVIADLLSDDPQPAMISSEAWVCRRSWNRTRGTSSRRRRGEAHRGKLAGNPVGSTSRPAPADDASTSTATRCGCSRSGDESSLECARDRVAWWSGRGRTARPAEPRGGRDVASYRLNRRAASHARKLIDAGKYVADSDWGASQPTADDENAFLRGATSPSGTSA
jgi:hypothetical protein